MKKNVICCGNIAYDLIETGSTTSGGFTFQAAPGGSVLNTAIHLARLGLNVTMVTKTGDDFLGNSLIETIKKDKINTSCIEKDKAFKTGLAFARLDKKGDSSYTFYRTGGPLTHLKKNLVPETLLKKAAVFHTASGYTYEDHSFEDVMRLIKRAKKHNVFVTYDPNWRENRIKNKTKTRKRIKAILAYTDLLKLSDTDATGITGAKTLNAALKSLPENIVVTLGEKGSFYLTGKKKITQKAVEVKVVDTIGAGDAFTAGLIYMYCSKGKDLFYATMRENLKFASRVSALICRRRGAVEGLGENGRAGLVSGY